MKVKCSHLVLALVMVVIHCADLLNTEAPEIAPPDSVNLAAPVKIYANAAVISWSQPTSENFAMYNLYYDTKPGVTDSSIFLKSIIYKNETSYLLSGLEKNTTYYAKVFVHNSSSYSESNEISFTTGACTCGAFSGERKDGMVLIPAGCFIGKDTSVVVISRDFYMDTTEVTIAEWNRVWNAAIMDTSEISKEEWDNILSVDTSTSLKPKVNRTWYQMILFCNEKSKQVGNNTCYTFLQISIDSVTKKISNLPGLSCDFTANGFRLPIEDEWEYAYRAGEETEYYWGKDGNTLMVSPYSSTYPATLADTLEISDHVWWDYNNEPSGVKEVARKKANNWGLYDMAGNAIEVVWNIKELNRAKSRIDYPGPQRNPQSMVQMVLRGGKYKTKLKFVFKLTAWWRSSTIEPDFGMSDIGFRTVCTK